MARIEDFQIDDYNTEEMAAHKVSPREVLQVLWSGDYKLHKNKKEHAARQPLIMVGRTFGGRVLHIPIGPVDDESGVWRPATAYDA